MVVAAPCRTGRPGGGVAGTPLVLERFVRGGLDAFDSGGWFGFVRRWCNGGRDGCAVGVRHGLGVSVGFKWVLLGFYLGSTGIGF